MIDKTEKDVMSLWPSNKAPLVSIRCTTFNQEKTIARALDGFLEQTTNFGFEIIVHDDASSDSTAKIIREYEEKFPNVVKPIYETENQYSKKDGSLTRAINPKLSGKYIATCEGDDFWCDSRKLQMLVDFLETNDDYSACAHNTELVSEISHKKKILYSLENGDVTLSDILSGNDFHYSSIVCRREFWFNRPSFCFKSGSGDYSLKAFLSLNGRIHRFGDVMSVYHYGGESSWTKRNYNDPEIRIRNYMKVVFFLTEANKWSSYKYDDVFKEAIFRYLYRSFLDLGQFRILKSAPYSSFWKSESMKDKIKHIFYYLKDLNKKFDKKSLIEELNRVENDNTKN